jgi:hypothetical protein
MVALAAGKNAPGLWRAPSGPRCPHCGGILESIRGRICQHCRSELRWDDDEPMTPQQFQERAHADAQQEKRLKARMALAAKASAERRERARETGRPGLYSIPIVICR